METEFQVYKMKRVLKMDGDDVCTMVWMYLIFTELAVHLKMVKAVNS